MTLIEWMDETGTTLPQLASQIGRTVEAVRRYITGARIPDRATMPLIVIATGGRVTPNDYYGIDVGTHGALALDHADTPTPPTGAPAPGMSAEVSTDPQQTERAA